MNDLSRGQNVIVLSPRRFGKTSLILEVLDRLKVQGMFTVYVDLYPVTSKDRFIATFAKAIAKAYTDRIEKVLREVKREAHAYHELWDRLTPRSKQLLEALAVDPSPQIYSKEFLTRHSLESPSVIQRAAKYLEREEIIERENAGHMFTDIFLKLWIKRKLL